MLSLFFISITYPLALGGLPREGAAVCAVLPAFVCPQQRQEREWRLTVAVPDACILQGCRGVEQHMWARRCCTYCFSSWPNPVGDVLCDNLPGAEGHCRHVTFLDGRAQIEIRKRDGRHKLCIAHFVCNRIGTPSLMSLKST